MTSPVRKTKKAQVTPAPTFDEAKLKLKLAKARTNLVLAHPFVGTIAMNMPYHIDSSIPTAATNGSWIKFNPEFLDKLTDEETVFLVAHECFHPMLEHPYRRHGRNHRKWNEAGDYVINQLLSDEKIGKMPEGGLLSKDIYDAGGGSTDGIYNILPEPQEGDCEGGDGGNGGGWSGNDLHDAEGTPAEQSQAHGEWQVRVAQAAQAAKMMGKMSVNMERLVGEILTPKVNWADVMHRFVEKSKTDERTFARPNRRFVQQGLYLPTVTGETMGEAAFCVDMSGSIDDRTANQFAAEVRKVFEDLRPSKLHIIFFSHEVCAYDSFGPDDEFKFNPRGGGGTAFSPCFKYMEDNGINPVACIFLTDLCCDDFGPAPEYPVLWVSTEKGTAPFGEVVLM
jgi:predicted metal-dependent peptidase